MEDKLEADDFISDDGQHQVEWRYYEDDIVSTAYPAWVCVTHNRLYYVDCVNIAQSE